MKIFLIYLALLLLFVGGCSNEDVSKTDFNIVLITIDALRADHLSCYGYHRNTSPNIDKIAEKGIVFNNVISPSSWTTPSMVSLFTSVYPINHGIIKGFAKGREIHNQKVFSDDIITLAELLKANGYETFGAASNLHLSEKFGFARGFDNYKCLPWQTAPQVNRVVYSWESQIKNSGKFFLWIHYFDPHHPLTPRTPWIEHYTSHELTQQLNLSNKSSDYIQLNIPRLRKEALSNLVALYDSDINYVDLHIGELIKNFELEENTLIIITADHGEEFFEHGQFGHGKNLFQETINIPLIIKLPHHDKKETIDEYVNLVDIMPTIIDILNINPPEQLLGKSVLEKQGLFFRLMQILTNREIDNYGFAELDRKEVLKAILTPEWKYIYNYKNKTGQLYNIKLDPHELNNLADKKTKECTKLKGQLLSWVASSKTYPVKSQLFEISQEEKEKLEAMGYLDTKENEDYDDDGISNDGDNCPYLFNPGQEDGDRNGIGDECQPPLWTIYNWLEAENAGTIVKPFEVAYDNGASEKRYIYSPSGTGNSYIPGSIMAAYKVTISKAGRYVLWGRVKVADMKDNSFFVQINNGEDNLWEIEPGNNWHWDAVNNRDYADPVKFDLTEGVHTVRIKLREDGTKLDKLLLTNDVSFIPRNEGDIAEKKRNVVEN